MSIVYANIRGALETAVKAYGETNGFQMAWPNRKFTPTIGKRWLRLPPFGMSPNQIGLGDGGYDRITGTFQVSLFFPADKGEGDSTVYLDLFRTAFARSTELPYGSYSVVIQRAYVATIMEEPDWYHVVMLVDWYGYEQY